MSKGTLLTVLGFGLAFIGEVLSTKASELEIEKLVDEKIAKMTEKKE